MTRSEMLQDVYYWLSGVQLDLAMALRDYVSNNGGLKKSAKKLNMSVREVRKLLDRDGIEKMSLPEFMNFVIKLGRCPDISIDTMLEDLYKTQSHESL